MTQPAENRTTRTRSARRRVSTAATPPTAQPAADPAPFVTAEQAALNLAIWSHVDRTDPTYTKPFQRSGGLRGTAVNAT